MGRERVVRQGRRQTEDERILKPGPDFSLNVIIINAGVVNYGT